MDLPRPGGADARPQAPAETLTAAELIERIASPRLGMPVRDMEALLAMGAEAAPGIIEALNRMEGRQAGRPLWLLVLLPRLAQGDAVAPLVSWLGRTDALCHSCSQAAAEGLAYIGAPALPALLEFLEEDRSWAERHWAYVALGSIHEEAARCRLVRALDEDPDLVDAAAWALVAHGRLEDSEHLERTLRECAREARRELDDALMALHCGADPFIEDQPPDDWRLRYRLDPYWARIAMDPVGRRVHWRSSGPPQGRKSWPVRTVEEIIAANEEWASTGDGSEYYPTGWFTGTGSRLALEQRGHLAILADAGYRDIFHALDVVEGDLLWALSQRTSEGVDVANDPDVEHLRAVRAGCIWLVERGVEDVERGMARLLEEAVRQKAIEVARRSRVEEDTGGPDPLTPRLLCRAHYHVDDPDGARELLARNAEVIDAGPSGPLFWTTDEGGLRIGEIAFQEKGLVLECYTRRTFAEGRRLVESALAGLARHRTDTEEHPIAPGDYAAADLMPTIVRRSDALRGRIENEASDNWADRPRAELGGRTAREAARTESGRRAVAELLSVAEARPDAYNPPYLDDWSWVWEELGIEDLREVAEGRAG